MVSVKTYKVGKYKIRLVPTEKGYQAEIHANGAKIRSFHNTAADAILGALDAVKTDS